MEPKQKVDQERLGELRGVLEKMSGSARKDWILEVYELHNGEDQLAEIIDIRTGEPLKKSQVASD